MRLFLFYEGSSWFLVLSRTWIQRFVDNFLWTNLYLSDSNRLFHLWLSWLNANSVVDGLLCLQLRKQLRVLKVFCQDWIFHKAFCWRHGHTQLQICLWNYLLLQNKVNFDNIKVTPSLCSNKALKEAISSQWSSTRTLYSMTIIISIISSLM